MSEHDIVRAWKDRRYRSGLSAAQREALPSSPAGAVEIGDERLGDAAGGTLTLLYCPTAMTCNSNCVCVTIVQDFCSLVACGDDPF